MAKVSLLPETMLVEISRPDQAVEIQVDDEGETLWVNVDGVCRLRVCYNNVPMLFEHMGHTVPFDLHMAGRKKDLFLQQTPEGNIERGLYKHYRGDIYEVFGWGRNSEYGYWSVYYRNIRTLECFDRPLEHFLGEATVSGGAAVKRFTRMTDEADASAGGWRGTQKS